MINMFNFQRRNFLTDCLQSFQGNTNTFY